jgi:hypothetical protein
MATPTLPQQLKRRDHDRLARYKKALDFYNGNQWPTSRTTRTARRLTLNYARSIVHKAAAALLKGRTNVVHPTDDTDPTTDDLAFAAEAETALNQVWRQNNLASLDFDTEIDCAVLGDAAYKVFWDNDLQQVRVSSPDPAGIFVWHWPDDPSRFWQVANTYTLDRDAVERTLGLPANDKNVIIETWTVDLYELWLNDALVATNANPYGFIPFVVFPNVREPKQLWGTSDLDTLYDPLQELNRELTQLSAIMELSGNPIASLSGVLESEDISVVPGAIWNLPKDARAELLDLLRGGGPKLHIDYLQAIYRIIHDLAETPRAAFGDTGGADLSGVALELELDPLVKKTERKRLIRTQAYRARNDMILALLDQFTGTALRGARHDIAWGSILPTDRDREVNNELALVAGGVHSRRYAADVLGGVDDPDAEFNRWLEEQQQATPTPQRSTTQ